MMSTLRQADAVFIDFKVHRDIIIHRSPPTFISAFGPIIAVSFAELAIIYIFYKYTSSKLDTSEVPADGKINSNDHVKFE